MSDIRPVGVREEVSLRILCSLFESGSMLAPEDIVPHSVRLADALLAEVERTRSPRPQIGGEPPKIPIFGLNGENKPEDLARRERERKP